VAASVFQRVAKRSRQVANRSISERVIEVLLRGISAGPL
jgi:hypothetical protein